jgi:putative hemolysin
MKTSSPRCVLLIFVVLTVAACSRPQTAEQSGTPEQSVMVTAANELAAMARLRAIAAAEASYQAESGGEYGSLDRLIQKRYVNNPSNGKLTGYKFDVQVRPGGFQATGIPEKYGITGKRSFYLDETNIIHAADKKGAPATAADPEA